MRCFIDQGKCIPIVHTLNITPMTWALDSGRFLLIFIFQLKLLRCDRLSLKIPNRTVTATTSIFVNERYSRQLDGDFPSL